MGKRSEHTRDELAVLILEAAYKIISEEGYDKVNTRRIAKEIGYTVGTLYNVYKSLEEIFIQVNSRALDVFIRDIFTGVEDISNIEEFLEVITTNYFKFAKEKFYLWQIIFDYQFSSEFEFPKWYTKKISSAFEMAAQYAGKMLKQNNCDIDPVTFTGLLWSTMHGLYSLSVRDKIMRVEILDQNKVIETMLKVFKNIAK